MYGTTFCVCVIVNKHCHFLLPSVTVQCQVVVQRLQKRPTPLWKVGPLFELNINLTSESKAMANGPNVQLVGRVELLNSSRMLRNAFVQTSIQQQLKDQGPRRFQ